MSGQNQPTAPNQAVLFPAYTWDYRLMNGKVGFGVVANRNIKKGELVFDNSLDYYFSDVIDGDQLLLDRYKKASKKSKTKKIPQYFPLTRDVLLRTHGVPVLTSSSEPTGDETTAGTVSWRLEVPGMMMNHSCDPNVTAYPPCANTAEGYAVRDIHKGEELTCEYAQQYYDHGPFFEKCMCGAKNCRGKMMGFKALSDDEKEKLLPGASEAVQAMHKADMGQGPPVQNKQKEFPARIVPPDDNNKVLRLVCPGPNCSFDEVIVKQTDRGEGEFTLCALKDFRFGEKVYEFWCQSWPKAAPSNKIDMVFATPTSETDPPEGTVIRFNAPDCAPWHRGGQFKFSGWDLLTSHSCEPNIVYNGEDSEEEEDWRGAYAATEIKAGDQITVDYNCLLWDRSECENADACNCGAAKCTGTMQGFRFLPRQAQEERKVMSWKRVAPPHEGDSGKVNPGEALAAHVRESWRNDPELKDDAPETASSGSSSSEESSDDD